MAASSPDPSPTRHVEQDAQAYLVLERLRWDGHPQTCPHCAAAGRCYLIRPSTGSVRRTRTGRATARRLWKCGACRRQFSVLTGTVLQGTRVPLPTWLTAVELLTCAEHEVSTGELCAATGLGREAARHVLTRWRATAQEEPLRDVLVEQRQLLQG